MLLAQSTPRTINTFSKIFDLHAAQAGIIINGVLLRFLIRKCVRESSVLRCAVLFCRCGFIIWIFIKARGWEMHAFSKVLRCTAVL